MTKTIMLSVGLLTLAAPVGNEAMAATTFYDIIPASACQIQNNDDIGKADLVDGSWLIGASTANDTVELLCPVRIPHFFVEGVTKTILKWDSWAIWYKDPDGVTANHSVEAKLIQAGRTTASGTVLDTIISNAWSTTTDTRNQDFLADYDENVPEAQYTIQVLMKQGSNNGSDRVRFTQVRLFVTPLGFN